MDINSTLNSFDIFIHRINNNKLELLTILIIIGLYTFVFMNCDNSLVKSVFTNNIFKLIFFIFITYVATSSPAIALALTIMMLVVLQLITFDNLKKEKFEIEPADNSYLNNEFLTNPLQTQAQLGSNVNLDLTVELPNQYYQKMLNRGRELVDDSYKIEIDAENRHDDREMQIAKSTFKKGMTLIDSGLNRLD